MPAADSAKAGLDSLAADLRARQAQDPHCYARESLTQCTLGMPSGAFSGSALSVVPAGILSLFKFHNAARMAFLIPTGGLAILFGFLGFVLGPVACP